ncbi:hypothetical protein FJY84_07850 [Candidatus Bathyarchaeota archaeon]|nr:hypothetical protein [Candidatus Bathyarchaeota archaeon]
MVEAELLSTLQSISAVATALGVCIAATYYVLTLKNTQKNMIEVENNRKATFSMNQLQFAGTEEWAKLYLEVMNFQFISFEEFKKKYDTSSSPENFAMRMAVLSRYEFLGHQYRMGLINLNDINPMTGYTMVTFWLKYKPIIEGYRKTEWPINAYSDYEYLAKAMSKKLIDDDPRLNEEFKRRGLAV